VASPVGGPDSAEASQAAPPHRAGGADRGGPATAPLIRFENVSKSYGPVHVIHDLNLDVADGEFLSLLGPSGSGKTTTLMMLAGFEPVSGGAITLGGRRIDDLAPHRRGMGVVFQNYALFPHMSVAENVAFPLRMRRTPRAETRERVSAALERVKLGAMSERRPAQLSGGQQQRVALARALVFEPQVILMDEPLGALDKQLREEMQLELRSLHRRLGLTFIFVTHDQGEALTMSDRIAVFEQGRIAQIGTPEDIYDRPRSRFVAQFIGETNLVGATVVAADAGGVTLRLDGGPDLRAAPPADALAPGARAFVSVRPERLLPGGDAGNRIDAIVEDVVYQGDHTRLHLTCGPLALVARIHRGPAEPRVGETVALGVEPAHCAVFPA
jgi:putative spermidine/putrescine transport system ATP-binding protein